MYHIEPEPVSAARSRRERENSEFLELSKLLPLPSAITGQLDKASVVRLTSTFLKLRHLFPKGLFAGNSNLLNSRPLQDLSSFIMQALDAFLFIASPSGRIMYISENASVFLGLSQVELVGNTIYEHVVNGDHGEVAEALHFNDSDNIETNIEEFECPREFLIRMRCVLPKRNAGITTNGFKTVHCTGFLIVQNLINGTLVNRNKRANIQPIALMALATTVPSSACTEVRMSNYSFMMRCNLDLNIVYVENRAAELLGFKDAREVVDRTFYQMVNPEDLQHVFEAHQQVLRKQQSFSGVFGLLTKSGASIKMVSNFTRIQNSRTSSPCIVLIIDLIER